MSGGFGIMCEARCLWLGRTDCLSCLSLVEIVTCLYLMNKGPQQGLKADSQVLSHMLYQQQIVLFAIGFQVAKLFFLFFFLSFCVCLFLLCFVLLIYLLWRLNAWYTLEWERMPGKSTSHSLTATCEHLSQTFTSQNTMCSWPINVKLCVCVCHSKPQMYFERLWGRFPVFSGDVRSVFQILCQYRSAFGYLWVWFRSSWSQSKDPT